MRQKALHKALFYVKGSKVVRKRNAASLSFQVLALFWLCFVTLINAFYDCNLRASLLVKDFARKVDSTQDIVDMKRKLFLAEGTGLVSTLAMYHKELYKQVKQDDERILINKLTV